MLWWELFYPLWTATLLSIRPASFPFYWWQDPIGLFLMYFQQLGDQGTWLEVYRPCTTRAAAILIQESSTFTPIIELLWKLTCRPEASWKEIKAFLTFIRYSNFGGQKIIVSSAYCKCEIFVPSLHIAMPSHRFWPTAFWMSRFRVSATRLKRKGDRGSPCRNPRCSLNGVVGELLMRIEAEAALCTSSFFPYQKKKWFSVISKWFSVIFLSLSKEKMNIHKSNTTHYQSIISTLYASQNK